MYRRQTAKRIGMAMSMVTTTSMGTITRRNVPSAGTFEKPLRLLVSF
jgi:hypothetical protein